MNEPAGTNRQTKHTDFRTAVGALDWRHPHWDGSYYPDDLPADWRLAYYANDFTCVLLSEAAWRMADEVEWGEWRDEVPPGFRFLLELDAGAPDRAAARCAETLGPAFRAWVSRTSAPESTVLRAAPIEQALEGAAPVILLSAADIHDRRALGRRFVALAQRPAPVLALIGEGDIEGEALKQVRIIAELAGLA